MGTKHLIAVVATTTALVSTLGLAQRLSAATVLPESTADAAGGPAGSGTPDAASPSDQGASNELKEIVVTGARQRSESAQSAPVATTVLTPRLIEQTHGNDITAIAALVPNLIIQESNSVVGLPSISLRGFNTKSSDIAAEPGIAVYVDGVYQTLQPGSLTDTFDLQSLEVLRGPQGTLLGRNAPAGAILLTRTRPTGKFGVRAQVEGGSYGLFQGQALVNFPIIKDVLAAKIYGEYHRRDGYIHNDFSGKDDGKERRGTIRGALLFTPSSNFTAYLSSEYQWDRSEPKPTRNIATPDTASCALFGFCNLGAGQVNVTSSDFVPKVYQNDYATTLVADWNVGPVTFKSTTGYRHYNSSNGNDLDNTPAIILHAYDDLTKLNSISEEFRMNSVKNGGLDLGGRFDWVIGAYIAHSNAFGSQNLNAFNGASIAAQDERVIRDNYAIFADGEFAITEPWSVSFGIRRSEDKIDHRFALAAPTSYPVPGPLPALVNQEKASFPRTSIEAGTRYKLDRDKIAYFRYSEGYLAGTFVGLPAALNTPLIRPETAKSYEIGLKTDWFDHRFRFNITLFHVDYRDLQISIVQAGPRGLQQAPANADVKTRGVEIESVLKASDALTFRGSFGYLKAKYGAFVVDLGNGVTQTVTGQQIPLAPKFNGNISADYRIDVRSINMDLLDNILLHGNFNVVSKQQTSLNGGDLGLQKGYSTGDFSISFNAPGDRYSITAYVNNVTDRHWRLNTQIIAGLVDFAQDNIGRTWGITAAIKF